MKEKLMSYKKMIVCACAAAAVVAVAAIVLLSTNREETYRSILVYDVMGSAVIERASVGTMDAAENLYLESGDRVSVAADSGMRLKLDDDKYVMAEADTIFSVEAEGTDADSRTKISLEQGAITNEIQNPLREGASYETSTPNSVMAVRGTIYRAELYADENGGQCTKLCCFQGKVGTKPVLTDGSYGEEVMVPAGSELTTYQDGTVSEVKDIVYAELPTQAIANLIEMLESGQSVTGVTLEELKQYMTEAADIGEASESGMEQMQQPETAQAGQSVAAGATAENDDDRKADAQEQAKADTAKPANKKQETPAVKTKPPVNQPPKKAEPVTGGSIDNGNTGGGSQGGNNADDGKSDKDKDKDQPAKPKTYKVTFMYQGKTFATQTVKSGETATAPVLVPDQSGAWDFDFGTKIEANTTVPWKKTE